jgi:hypothetical protein
MVEADTTRRRAVQQAHPRKHCCGKRMADVFDRAPVWIQRAANTSFAIVMAVTAVGQPE